MTYSLSQMLEPLQSIQGITLAYIRVMRCDYWDFVQSIEWKTCEGSTVKSPDVSDIVEEASESKNTIVEISNEGDNTEELDVSDKEEGAQEAEDHSDSHSEEAQKTF